jgi:hypothetical protein
MLPCVTILANFFMTHTTHPKDHIMRLRPSFYGATLALACVIALAACTTESEDEGGTNLYAHLVNDWKIQTATVSPLAQLPAIPGVPTIPTTANLLLVISNCDQEATFSFRSNGVFINTKGTGCSDHDTGSWVRNDSLLYISYTDSAETPDTLTIVELSDSVFKMKERNNDLPDRVWRTISYTLIPR